MPSVRFLTGDVLAILKTLPADHFDAVLSDPPYGLSFMGKEWDRGVPSAEVYAELLRVLKPGAFGLHFGGTRTFHRLAVNLEDAGFEMKDCLSWLYGSGFPKSHNISKALGKQAGAERENCEASTWDGYGTALKPAWEPCLLVQKPLTTTYANNVLEHGCGALDIDGCKVGAGRFPANLILDEEAAAALDAQSGILKSDKMKAGTIRATRAGNALGEQCTTTLQETIGDQGGASRFFYTAKVSTRERNAGCEQLEPRRFETNAPYGQGADARAESSQAGSKNNHPTLKPLSLTEYLAKLLLVPPRADGQPRRILVPFSGAGSEAIGAALAGWDEVVGIELDPAYVAIAESRVAHWVEAERKAA